MNIAIMQPYFLPYAGYFRLFSIADLVVILDCVQFTRRGFIHRNTLPNITNQATFLTLPIKKSSQQTLIKDLTFAENAQQEMYVRLRKFPEIYKFY